MTEPLVHAEVDLRDFPYMPLDVVRLRDSDLFTHASAEAFRAAVILWCAAWHQVPAGSLPNDNSALYRLAGLGRLDGNSMRTWVKLKKECLRGFVLCDDGRLYHTVVAEKARQAWEQKQKQKDRTKAARDARSVTKNVTTSVTADVTASVTGSKGTEQNGSTEAKASVEAHSLPQPQKAKRAKARTPIDPQAEPTADDRDAAMSAGLTESMFRSEWRKYRDHHLAKGSLMADWAAAWRTWVGNIAQFQPVRSTPDESKSVHAAAKRLHERLLDLGDAPKPIQLLGNSGG